ncbi:hybrid sensor histidine kinase/response regulator [Bradyrhizobium sp. U87765 SZCCT0131]|uniref:hybrid sensor histidine kinase/response regulator n=1 Tax=unclassified Bradyrhizobium TaxID=2631580 RepID=UPI001BA5D9AE|nr:MULTISPECIES: hybrid sensor histidine kinase/response regulator [unclassified Bradyrhizobium]MBR1220974.1 hybrid sensor histidine kinase/response regulator [Bradyrhizobium sp. U87765 SZCCT0131]MBR1260206.1 hybrid sensor histidine kinase/response regulator [Bradyrhizobium sp. U87765 SZCCT0134]MBR1307545.1 hybrid sensor histidine kinase/response regulator [Bradyrhizobium sp. U87765 SZCCT0110]MBR1321499.1 hybrid sensor histidine kinase/response regulator [Bradyrhizobium sp. U87765 SZCCT0109]MB
MQNWGVIAVAFGYIGLLFVIASYGDRLSQAQRARAGLLIYPLSLAIYCTSWTFFGSIGFASRTSIEFLAIYVGPVLLIGFCTPLLLRIIHLAKAHNITSVADFVGARYGKSQAVAATAAVIAIIGSVPYIALQLKAVASSLETILGEDQSIDLAISHIPLVGDIALVVTIAMALFAVLFGTRQTDATEHQHGLVLAVAAESIVKLVVFLVAGAFITFLMFSPHELIDRAMKTPEAARAINYAPSIGNFVTMTVLSFFAVMLLPRQFHVSVVENTRDAEVRRARWMFPLYLVAINLFVIPVALAGLVTFPFGAIDSDMYLLALPIADGSNLVSIAVFVGGLSASTAMVIVECVALAIMVSNDLVVPLMLRRSPAWRDGGQNFAGFLLNTRRLAIFAIMLMAYCYYRALGNAQLAAIGLLSFAAIAQLAPSFLFGMVWRRATARGAIGGMVVGFIVWAYTLFLPSLSDLGPNSMMWLQHGPLGIELLRPQALLGSELPPLMHGVLWSLSLNCLTYVLLSLMRQPSAIERVQADLFVPNQLAPMTPSFRRWRTTVTVQDLLGTVAQYLGPERTRLEFESFAGLQRISLDRSAPADFRLLRHAEHLIASSIGAASSRVVMSLLLRKRTVSAKAALKLLDDAHAALHFNQEMLQTALNHVRQGIAVFDADLQLIVSNRQFGELLDLPPYILQNGVPLRDILEVLDSKPAPSAPGHSLIEKRLAAYTAEGEPYLERLAERNLVIEVRANRMPGGALVITFSDITPSVEAAEALERANASLENRVRERTEELTRLNSELAQAKSTAEDANASKTRFLAAASHDVLQPLNAARLYVTSLVERERERGGDNARLVENIDESLEAIEDILGALLDISRLDAGAMTPSISSFRIGDLMRSLEIEFAPVARAKDLTLTFMPCALPVESDRVLLRRLLQNLISNAIKYTPHGRVLVGCRRRGRSLQIDIYDTGVGIPVQKRREIFKEFHRLDQGARIARGLGLGLSIVERIARVLSHTIAIDANRSGGSRFSVTLPIASAITYTAAVTSATPLSRAPMSGTRIVCIENDPAILDGMKTLLTGWDAQVIAALDLSGAIDAIAAADGPITGLLVDYHLDRGNGVAAIRDIRSRFGRRIPAILITADRSPGVRAAAAGEGIVVLNKPLKPAALRALLGQWRAQQMIAAE